ncbi:hypothetical protein [Marinobacter salsuginis]|uniref:Uncharacterized protein n=1 Tax=Marinobacter salsuginis TaxID=418719 RepID=A0A5M3Q3Q1_9GAMM|nr:hypothetical protein [Marinobacter salsuginis]GBO89885.1 hypothetical protein MSSD14B_35530 [Marinobacter salsuginis]
MDWADVFKIVTASVASIGVAGGLIFALSSWLGKVWARRILDREKNELDRELEAKKRELDIFKDTYLRTHNDKLVIYRAVIDSVAKLLAAFDAHQSGRLQAPQAAEAFDSFNQQRLQVYGYLGMLAPQPVIDAQDKLTDHLLMISGGSASYDWEEIRQLAIAFINEVRIDVGIDKDPISYNGDL